MSDDVIVLQLTIDLVLNVKDELRLRDKHYFQCKLDEIYDGLYKLVYESIRDNLEDVSKK